MHILYLHQHFATPAGTTGTRSYEFARRWAKAGHKVTVITGHFDIGGLDCRPVSNVRLSVRTLDRWWIKGVNTLEQCRIYRLLLGVQDEKPKVYL